MLNDPPSIPLIDFRETLKTCVQEERVWLASAGTRARTEDRMSTLVAASIASMVACTRKRVLVIAFVARYV